MRLKGLPLAAKVAVIIILLAVIAWLLGPGIIIPEPEDTVPVTAVKADNRVIADGVVLPQQYANLALASSGVVAEILVGEGDLVTEGQILARMENSQLMADKESAQAELDRATSNLNTVLAGTPSREIKLKEAQKEEAQAEYELYSANYKRYQALYEQGGASQQELEQARVDAIKAGAALKKAQAELEIAVAQGPEAVASARAEQVAAKARLQASIARLDQSELRAPFSGMIAAVDIRVGEAVPGCTPIIYLADCSAWQIKTEDLSELDIARVKKGSPASISFDALPGLVLPARVVHIRTMGEKKSGDMTYTVTLKPTRQDSRLYWNMKALVKIGQTGNTSSK